MAYLGTFGGLGLGATWSLAVEEQFYLTIPFGVRRLNRFHLTCLVIVVILGAPVLRTLLLYKLPHGDFADYVLMPCRADALCLGVLAAILVRNVRVWKVLVDKRRILNYATLLPLCGVVWLMYKGYGFTDAPMAAVGYSFLALFYTCCLLIALSGAGFLQRVLCDTMLIQVGKVSYCVYLIHQRLIAACRYVLWMCIRRFDSNFADFAGFILLVGGLLGIVLSFVIAKFSWKLLEQPMLRRGHEHRY